jgi:hypothetical protein
MPAAYISYDLRNLYRKLYVGTTMARKLFRLFYGRYNRVISIHFDCDHNEKHSRRCLAVCCIRFTLNVCVM